MKQVEDGHALLCAWHIGKVCDCGYAASVPADISARINISYATARSAALEESSKRFIVDSLNTDTARLDYMQKNEITVSCSPAIEEPWAVMPRTDDGKPGPMFTGETLRSAIDAAMAGDA